MKKRSKKYVEALSKFDKSNIYTKEEAVKLVKETSTSSFDGSIEIAMRLNLDTKKADQQLRGAIVLPKGTGKTKKVLVVTRGPKAQEARDAGADYVGDTDMLEKIENLNNLRNNGGYKYLISVDVGINEYTAIKAKKSGADILVSGSYICHHENFNLRINSLKK